MRWLRQYDRDLRPLVLLQRLLLAANLLAVVYFAWRREWVLGLANLLWAWNVRIQAAGTTKHQQWRDEMRLHRATWLERLP